MQNQARHVAERGDVLDLQASSEVERLYPPKRRHVRHVAVRQVERVHAAQRCHVPQAVVAENQGVNVPVGRHVEPDRGVPFAGHTRQVELVAPCQGIQADEPGAV